MIIDIKSAIKMLGVIENIAMIMNKHFQMNKISVLDYT